MKSKTLNPIIKPGIYRHYKGKFYRVVAVARHSEDLTEMVVYQALYRTKFGLNSWWVRPKKMFEEKVVINQQRVPRFKYVGLQLTRVKRASH